MLSFLVVSTYDSENKQKLNYQEDCNISNLDEFKLVRKDEDPDEANGEQILMEPEAAPVSIEDNDSQCFNKLLLTEPVLQRDGHDEKDMEMEYLLVAVIQILSLIQE